MNILVSGGAGFIGSHACFELLDAGHDIIVFDNYYNSSPEALANVEELTGKSFKIYECDMLDRASIEKIFEENTIDAVIHFAGYKAVGESVAKPLMYYNNNITGTVILLETMAKYNVKKIVFSSSATVYGVPETVPINESFPLGVTNPYGRTKLMIEDILRDVCVSDKDWSVVILRYFNPVGAHASSKLRENPKGIPNNLMPRLIQAAKGEVEYLTVFGDDYPTRDGTGVRDYIHVVDLAKGHVKAIDYIADNKGAIEINLGTGNGCSVLELIKTFEKVNGVTVPHKIVERRPGDVAECYADPSLAKELLGWSAVLGLEEMCRDSWRAVMYEA
ncbi:MAG: UDP-glucose 4-epimerase GalE [Ruminococcaceae bacterium]|nr:UDP-glucose 4-epimerase GalE [Oscillospiraceae bacterium]